MINWDQKIKDEWRELGFYYDYQDKEKQWRFFGSKEGLKRLIAIIEEYLSNPSNEGYSQENAYGPYTYLKIMTWDQAIITPDYFAGTLENLSTLKNIIAIGISKTNIGQSFNLSQYGNGNKASATFFIMPNNFDPVSMDDNYN